MWAITIIEIGLEWFHPNLGFIAIRNIIDLHHKEPVILVDNGK
jgi:hypothetical protein